MVVVEGELAEHWPMIRREEMMTTGIIVSILQFHENVSSFLEGRHIPSIVARLRVTKISITDWEQHYCIRTEGCQIEQREYIYGIRNWEWRWRLVFMVRWIHLCWTRAFTVNTRTGILPVINVFLLLYSIFNYMWIKTRAYYFWGIPASTAWTCTSSAH